MLAWTRLHQQNRTQLNVHRCPATLAKPTTLSEQTIYANLPCVVYPGQIACVLFLVMCVLWSQLLYPLALNSKTLFEAIVDGNDQAASASVYNKWLLGLYSDEVRSCFKSVFRAYYLTTYCETFVLQRAALREQNNQPRERQPRGLQV